MRPEQPLIHAAFFRLDDTEQPDAAPLQQQLGLEEG
jgi:hypothetical protein